MILALVLRVLICVLVAVAACGEEGAALLFASCPLNLLAELYTDLHLLVDALVLVLLLLVLLVLVLVLELAVGSFMPGPVLAVLPSTTQLLFIWSSWVSRHFWNTC